MRVQFPRRAAGDTTLETVTGTQLDGGRLTWSVLMSMDELFGDVLILRSWFKKCAVSITGANRRLGRFHGNSCLSFPCRVPVSRLLLIPF